MSVLERIVQLFAPFYCLGCDLETDSLICGSCAATIALVPSRCYRCKAVTEGFRTCRDCRGRTALYQVVVYSHYKDLPKGLVHRTKYERARSGATEMARLSAALLREFDESIVLSHVPTATGRVRMRGYDQAQVFARGLTRLSGVPNATFLARTGQAHQVGANRTARLRQLQGAFRPVHSAEFAGKHIVLVDDVLTTGATVESAAKVLKKAGAKRVSALVFAQA